jgi:transcriptional regulator with XRE-family HTH domain
MLLSQTLTRRPSSTWSRKLVEKLSNRDYRLTYVAEHVKTWIARQIRTLREERGWSQEELGQRSGKTQSVISRLEDPDYGRLTIQTLLDLSAAFDVALEVRFVDFPGFLRRSRDLSTDAMKVASFNAFRLAAIADEHRATIYSSDDSSHEAAQILKTLQVFIPRLQDARTDPWMILHRAESPLSRPAITHARTVQ